MCKLVTGFRTKKVSTFFRTIQNSQRTGVSTFKNRTCKRTDQRNERLGKVENEIREVVRLRSLRTKANSVAGHFYTYLRKI